MNKENATKIGRPPLEANGRLAAPRNVRYSRETLRVAKIIADERFGGNVSRGLRLLAHIGALAWEAKAKQE